MHDTFSTQLQGKVYEVDHFRRHPRPCLLVARGWTFNDNAERRQRALDEEDRSTAEWKGKLHRSLIIWTIRRELDSTPAKSATNRSEQAEKDTDELAEFPLCLSRI
ncbi:hypothetical protein RB195_009794 [Necator americanus]|uniref:Uncharacterized protein n=1 Tax=Necator americanus TaxID=51031 RepID=A0ABR1CUX5_NECAM